MPNKTYALLAKDLEMVVLCNVCKYSNSLMVETCDLEGSERVPLLYSELLDREVCLGVSDSIIELEIMRNAEIKTRDCAIKLLIDMTERSDI